jgi:5-methylcytosine-specific restriction endonuclease McrA
MAEPKVRRRRPGWKMPVRTCVVCFGIFQRKQRGKDTSLCCSRECGFTLIRWKGEQSRRFHEAKAQFAKWAKRAKPKPILPAPVVRSCQCGAPLDKGKQYCCHCAAQRRLEAKRRSPARRADKAYRKAIHRGLTLGAEKFDPLEVLARDGWRCHICGVSTPKRLRGTYDGRAPELDHIVPLARGGQHTRLNTACACRRCNGMKANKPLGQLRLVA